MSAISWIHLSDWHQKGPSFDRDVVRGRLLADIDSRQQIDSTISEINFVIFSGDAAFSGQKQEFEAIKTSLFTPLLARAGLKPDRLFLVPGNHDLDRSVIPDLLPAKLQAPLTSDREVQHWLTDDKRRQRALEPFAAYESFVEGYTGQRSPAYASIRQLEISGKRVALLGLNSAWMCARHHDAAGKVDDLNHLVIGEPQFHDALQEIAGADIRVVVCHHALEWLARFDRDRVEEQLFGKVDFVLWGHEHRPKIEVKKVPAGQSVIIPGGAAFDGRTPDNARYTNAYNLVRLDLETGRGVVHLRRWNDGAKAWVADADTARNTDGRFSFTLDRLTAKRRGKGAGSGATRTTSSGERIAAAGQRYQDLLLKSCDLIDLVNLPEDQHIVHRQLELRQLYVPLRAWVDITAEELVDDTICTGLEQRRDQIRGGKGGPAPGHKRERAPIMERLAKTRRLVIRPWRVSGLCLMTRPQTCA